ncbi:DUF1345 domain-containing protein [Microbacterium schleiferi]|uniref:DUF1345 domain-containing protein n=1 Tax=Microbacterium schleiferi TaxID=69362 RepID=A0A7S8MXV5_9MICO|nr:DUF1345 domain-containing protein [Microbacterium schleiferi]QPE05165.1 DUF1345 domain-containing protein [Microbacterium schleiferi]
MPRPPLSRAWRAAVFVTGWIIQLAVAATGVVVIRFDSIDGLLIWCLGGSLYAIGAMIVLAVLARRDTPAPETVAIEKSWWVSVMVAAVTILPSFVGVFAAVTVVIFDDGTDYGFLFRLIGIWAMVLSWGLLHWGFAQWYMYRYRVAADPPLRFPRTPEPSIVDFTYLAFTIGTTFAVSDVETHSSRIRWLMTLHSVISFFFNGAIVVFALSRLTAFGA